MYRRLLCFLVSALLLANASHAQTAVTCHIKKFFAPAGSSLAPLSNATAINRWGNITGQAAGGKAYIRFTDGRVRALPVNIPDYPQVFPGKRNAFGVSVGYSTTSVGTLRRERSWVLSGNDLRIFSVSGYPNLELAGINRYGSLVGNLQGSAITVNNGFKYKNGQLMKLNIPVAHRVSAISDTGVIVGSYVNNTNPQPFDDVHGFAYANGTYQDVSMPGAGSTFPTDINASGMIVGVTEGPGGSFIYRSGVFYKPIFVLPDGRVVHAEIYGVNGYGQITGVADVFEGRASMLGSCF